MLGEEFVKTKTINLFKFIFTYLILYLFSSFLYGQIEETINTIENCNIEIENDSTPIINKVRKNTFYLPKGWQGDFYEDNPTLYVKKIIENHDGFITASGQVSQGATFDIYLPVNQVKK